MMPTREELNNAGLDVNPDQNPSRDQLRDRLNKHRDHLRDELAKEIPGTYSTTIGAQLKACDHILSRLSN